MANCAAKHRMLGLIITAGALTVSACAGIGTQSGTQPGPPPPIEPGPIGPVLARPGEPPLECRRLPQDRCEGVGQVPATAGAIRVVVSCEGAPCTAVDGAFRIDVLMADGSSQQVGRGVYGNAVQPIYPPATSSPS